MLSMAGLLEEAPSPQESWWAGSTQRSLQGGKSPMDSQGNSSSEAWDNQGLPSPDTEYQYCDPSMSPPLHPSKRNAPNPPPISNQATKGLAVTLLTFNREIFYKSHFLNIFIPQFGFQLLLKTIQVLKRTSRCFFCQLNIFCCVENQPFEKLWECCVKFYWHCPLSSNPSRVPPVA